MKKRFNDNFYDKYREIKERAVSITIIADREGCLKIESHINQDKLKQRDVYEYGLQLIINGTTEETTEIVLKNIVNQEIDEQSKIFKTIQKEAVMFLFRNESTSKLLAIMNSYTDLTLEEDNLYDLGEHNEKNI